MSESEVRRRPYSYNTAILYISPSYAGLSDCTTSSV